MGNSSNLEKFWKQWEQETKDLCGIKTFRETDQLTDAEVIVNLKECRTYITNLASNVNNSLSKHKLVPFQWCADEKLENCSHNPSEEEIDKSKFWVFGYRIGPDDAAQKFSLICHLDTVPAASGGAWEDIDPFTPESVPRDYDNGTASPQDFLVGRGCIDDKGPAMSAFAVVRALALDFDNTEVFDKTQLEIIFDSSEESAMSTPRYFDDPATKFPDFGIVYDAMWCVRAEKGGERPVFNVKIIADPTSGLFCSSLITCTDNSCNTIPDWAEAVICGDVDALKVFKESVSKMFSSFEYDDPDYYRGELKVKEESDSSGNINKVILTINVEGAQHGSAPHENRDNGVNPLVSLANFVAGLASDEIIAGNAWTTMAEFIRFTWGTHAFGEDHPNLLYRFDDVFCEGNGTTYAVTKTSVEDDAVKLEIDIRYAIGHHESEWDGYTEGEMLGESKFKKIFCSLIEEFNRKNRNLPDVSLAETNTLFGPDIRTPDTNPYYLRAEQAFNEEMGYNPPRYALGGGTDAKGNLALLAMGPLFDPSLGYPINYHGIGEGAPVTDMHQSTKILYNFFASELKSPTAARMRQSEKDRIKKISLDSIKRYAKNGQVHCCSH